MKSLLIPLIRSEILGCELDQNIIDACRGEDSLRGILALASSHDVANIAASSLSRAGLLDGGAAAGELEKQLMLSLYRYEQLRFTLSEVSRILCEAKISHIPLKGAVIRDYYPKPWMRTSCDIDVLIHRSDAEAAISALTSCGYIKQNDVTEHDFGLNSPGGVRLELHYTLAQDGALPSADKVLDCVWDNALPQKDGSYVMNMTNEMFVLYHVAHMAKHVVFGGCGIKPFIDLWLIINKMHYDKNVLSDLLLKADLHKFYLGAEALASVWFGGEEHTSLSENFEEFILSGGVYGDAENHAAVKAAKGQGRIKTFLGVAFLPRRKLEIIYPNLRRRPILTPFYQVKRWFRVFNKKRRRKIAGITSARNRVTEDMSNSAELLLSGLGLQ